MKKFGIIIATFFFSQQPAAILLKQIQRKIARQQIQ